MALSDFRLREMFSGLFPPTQQTQQSPMNQAPESSPNMTVPMLTAGFPNSSSDSNTDQTNQDDEYNKIREMFPMQHEASDRMKTSLDSMPKREDYKPGKMKHILAAIAAMGEDSPSRQYATKQGILDKDYNNAMEDYNSKLKPLEELSQNERGDNSNQRIGLNNYLQNDSRNKSIDQRDSAAKMRSDTAANALKEKTDYFEFKQQESMRKGTVMKSDSTGHLFSWNPNDGSIEYLYNPESGEKLSSDKLPEEEKLKIQQNNKISAQNNQGSQSRQNIAATGGQQRQNIAARTEGTNSNIDARGEQTRKNIAAKPVPSGSSSSNNQKHKIGDEKVFPNGKVGRWDGTGFIDTGKVAK